MPARLVRSRCRWSCARRGRRPRPTAFAEVRALKLYNLHTHERATIVFKRNGVYDQAGLTKLNEFLRDWRKDKPTNMDPHLFDLLWQVYQQSGSHDYIHVVCGYRSPATNDMLRRRSSGVAKNSLHMQGKAMDFSIPDVPLAKLRAIGLQMQVGGVGFYPTSGSPFVHMDTGNVRHWPRMSRQQLVARLPERQDPAHSLRRQAAARLRRRRSPPTRRARPARRRPPASPASTGSPVIEDRRRPAGKPMRSPTRPSPDDEATTPRVATEADADSRSRAAPPPPAPARRRGRVAAYATAPRPMPRLAPRRPQPCAVAALPSPPATRGAEHGRRSTSPRWRIAAARPTSTSARRRTGRRRPCPPRSPRAMAERDQTRRGASLPIAPTAVVATIDVSRRCAPRRSPPRCCAGTPKPSRRVPRLLAYAPAMPRRAGTRRCAERRAAAAHQPAAGIRRRDAQPARRAAPGRAGARRMTAPQLTMTTLDTQGLRLWIGPDLDPPEDLRPAYHARLRQPRRPDGQARASPSPPASAATPTDLRTDRFSGPLVEQPAMVDLRHDRFVASIR